MKQIRIWRRLPVFPTAGGEGERPRTRRRPSPERCAGDAQRHSGALGSGCRACRIDYIPPVQIGEQFEVSIRGWFAAAHQLRLLDGSVEPLHGHNWQVCVTFAGERLDGMSVLVDFVAARRELDALLATLHDRNLNDLPPFAGKNPSAEIVAVHVAQELSRRTAGILAATGVRLACVEIEEAPGCVARFRAEVRPPARP